ncbi:MAG: HNH endonuclease [Alphaproteobacteria bacterium]|nr:HNH endonuclease [Alphaproteobacteria bacterium]
MDISEVVKKSKTNQFLLGLLFGNIKHSNNSNEFYVYSKYKNNSVILSKREMTDSEKKLTHTSLEQKTELTWLSKSNKKQLIPSDIKNYNHLFVFKNSNNLTYINIYNELLTNVRSLDIDIKEFFAGFFSCRASIDKSSKSITIDYWYDSDYELETKTRALLNSLPLSDISAVFPINFRELQKDQIEGANRETQFRMKANWFFNKSYLINPYKQECLKKIANNMGDFKPSNTIPDLLSRVKRFSEIIYSQNKLSEEDIEKYRSNIGLDPDSNIENIRDKKLINLAWGILPDKCAGCNEKYQITDRTFPSKTRDGRYYLEIHHIISLGDNKELDTEFNLSKLCPACHTSLRKGRASEEYQKEVISNILNYSETDTESIKCYLDISDNEQVIKSIQQRLL